jgi:hypothetical protein
VAPVSTDFLFGDGTSWSNWTNSRRVSIQLDMFQPTCKILIKQGHAVSIKDRGSKKDLVGFYAMSREEWPERMLAVFAPRGWREPDTVLILIDSDDDDVREVPMGVSWVQ